MGRYDEYNKTEEFWRVENSTQLLSKAEREIMEQRHLRFVFFCSDPVE